MGDLKPVVFGIVGDTGTGKDSQKVIERMAADEALELVGVIQN